jgi:hypothetical protein
LTGTSAVEVPHVLEHRSRCPASKRNEVKTTVLSVPNAIDMMVTEDKRIHFGDQEMTSKEVQDIVNRTMEFNKKLILQLQTANAAMKMTYIVDTSSSKACISTAAETAVSAETVKGEPRNGNAEGELRVSATFFDVSFPYVKRRGKPASHASRRTSEHPS